MKKNYELFIEVAGQVAEGSEGTIRLHRHYSGRGMFGEQCLGITVDREISEVGLGAKLILEYMVAHSEAEDLDYDATPDENEILDILERSCTDSMGLGTIVYFPGIPDPVNVIEEDFL